MDILESCINFKAISDFSNIWFDVCFAGSVKILERIVMFKKRTLFIILACLAFFCMVPVKAQNAAFSQPEKGISLEEMTEKAEKGDTDAQYFLGTFYLSVVEEGKNQQKAVYWLQKAADGGNAEAQLRLGMMYAMGEKIPKDEKKAVSLVMQSAEQGFPMAQFLLYCGYSEHEEDRQKYLRIKQQLDEDIRYFFDGILAFASAMRKQGITSDTQKAIDWLQKAAEQELVIAQDVLANRYAEGIDVERDDKKAAYWLEKVAQQGAPFAQNSLATMYANGQGVPQDYGKAVYWYQKAADQNDAYAQGNLGTIYYYGYGVPRNYEKAIYWYQKAAEQGLASAQYDLAIVYMTGEGVPRDYRKALQWIRKAARQGYRKAQLNLGLMYATGKGIKKNYLFAYVLFNQVAVTLDSARELRDQMEAKMTPGEVAKAQAMTIDDVLK